MQALAALFLGAIVTGCGSSGTVREPTELLRIEAPQFEPRVRWEVAPGAVSRKRHSGLRLAVEADALFCADTSGRAFALSSGNGRQLWRTDTGARVISGPTVSDALVLLGTLDAEVIALRRADGILAWRVPVSSEVLATPVGGGRLVVARGGDGKLFGLTADTGARVWSFDRAVPPLTLRGMSVPQVYGGTVFVGLDNGRVAALRLSNGELLWEQVVAAPSGRTELERIVDVDANLVVDGGGVYAVSFGGELAAIDLSDGRVAWRRSIKSYSGIALAGDVLAVTDEEGLVWALDPHSGAALWKQDVLKYRRLSPPAMQNGYIVVADLEGYVHWLAPQDGRIVARAHVLNEPVQAAPVVRDNVLYVLDSGGHIAAVEIPAL
ncbi:MAG: outer membrane protein assembly factor BamB [Nevskiales bacterium]|nr:outer membrane protein assembly factor BamB [Nevskiales bacterium]